jgi:hypothetical protein
MQEFMKYYKGDLSLFNTEYIRKRGGAAIHADIYLKQFEHYSFRLIGNSEYQAGLIGNFLFYIYKDLLNSSADALSLESKIIQAKTILKGQFEITYTTEVVNGGDQITQNSIYTIRDLKTNSTYVYNKEKFKTMSPDH